jgi:ribosome biogenesis GTPase A
MINWYPGHVAKWDNALAETLKQVEVVVEVLDARLPLTTAYPNLRERLNNKPVVRVLNKSALAEKRYTLQWMDWWAEQDALLGYENSLPLVAVDAIARTGKTALVNALMRAGEPLWVKQAARGLKPAPLKVLVMGLPNVGKSTVINWLVGQKKAPTGHKAGVTRQARWIRVHPRLSLMDSPGTLPSKLDSSQQGLLLACVSSVGEAAFDTLEAAEALLQRVDVMKPGLLEAFYEVEPEETAPGLERIAYQRCWLDKGKTPDLERTANAVLKDFRTGRWGALSLERPV